MGMRLPALGQLFPAATLLITASGVEKEQAPQPSVLAVTLSVTLGRFARVVRVSSYTLKTLDFQVVEPIGIEPTTS